MIEKSTLVNGSRDGKEAILPSLGVEIGEGKITTEEILY